MIINIMNETIKKKVMRRVYLAYVMRTLRSRVALECYALIVAAAVFTQYVSMPHIFANAPGDSMAHLFRFGTAAFANTEIIVQAVVVGMAAIAAMMIRDIRGVFGSAPARKLTRA